MHLKFCILTGCESMHINIALMSIENVFWKNITGMSFKCYIKFDVKKIIIRFFLPEWLNGYWSSIFLKKWLQRLSAVNIWIFQYIPTTINASKKQSWREALSFNSSIILMNNFTKIKQLQNHSVWLINHFVDNSTITILLTKIWLNSK